MSETSKTGVWIDRRTDKVVEREPVEGIQLVAAGGSMTPAVAKRIEAERAARTTAAAEEPAGTATKAPPKAPRAQ